MESEFCRRAVAGFFDHRAVHVDDYQLIRLDGAEACTLRRDEHAIADADGEVAAGAQRRARGRELMRSNAQGYALIDDVHLFDGSRSNGLAAVRRLRLRISIWFRGLSNRHVPIGRANPMQLMVAHCVKGS